MRIDQIHNDELNAIKTIEKDEDNMAKPMWTANYGRVLSLCCLTKSYSPS